jgi:hypothetical protein
MTSPSHDAHHDRCWRLRATRDFHPARTLGAISSSRCQKTRYAGSCDATERKVELLDEPRAGELRRSGWWSQTGSNRRPPACKAGALPTELWPLRAGSPSPRLRRAASFLSGLPVEAAKQRRLVGLGRFELPTSRLSSARSNQLSYKPLVSGTAELFSARP